MPNIHVVLLLSYMKAKPINDPFRIHQEMESGELPLERALELFERGMKLSDACRKQLEEAETRVEVLMKRAGQRSKAHALSFSTG